MLSRGLLFFTDIPLTVAGMLLFFGTFITIAAWTFFRSGSLDFYQSVANLPLGEEVENRHE